MRICHLLLIYRHTSCWVVVVVWCTFAHRTAQPTKEHMILNYFFLLTILRIHGLAIHLGDPYECELCTMYVSIKSCDCWFFIGHERKKALWSGVWRVYWFLWNANYNIHHRYGYNVTACRLKGTHKRTSLCVAFIILLLNNFVFGCHGNIFLLHSQHLSSAGSKESREAQPHDILRMMRIIVLHSPRVNFTQPHVLPGLCHLPSICAPSLRFY